MAMATAIAAGERARNVEWPMMVSGANPYQWRPQAIPQGTRTQAQTPGQTVRFKPTAAEIHQAAQQAALAERAMDLKEREQSLKEEVFREQKQQNYWNRVAQGRAEARADEQAYEQGMQGIQTRHQTELEGIRRGRTHERDLYEKRRRDDFALARHGLATNNPQPIVRFFQQYGDPNANIKNIEFAPVDPKTGQPIDEGVMVEFEGVEKPAYFENKEQFFKGLMGWADPDVEKKLSDMSLKEREQGRKETETAGRLEYWRGLVGNKGVMTDKQLGDLITKWTKEFRADMDANTLPEGIDTVDQYIEHKMSQLGPGVAPTGGIPGRDIQGAQAPEGPQAVKPRAGGQYTIYPQLDDAGNPTGAYARVYEDGRQELYSKDHKLQQVYDPSAGHGQKGSTTRGAISEPTPEGGERVRVPVSGVPTNDRKAAASPEAPEEKKEAVPTRRTYKWRDKDGTPHITSTPPPPGALPWKGPQAKAKKEGKNRKTASQRRRERRKKAAAGRP